MLKCLQFHIVDLQSHPSKDNKYLLVIGDDSTKVLKLNRFKHARINAIGEKHYKLTAHHGTPEEIMCGCEDAIKAAVSRISRERLIRDLAGRYRRPKMDDAARSVGDLIVQPIRIWNIKSPPSGWRRSLRYLKRICNEY